MAFNLYVRAPGEKRRPPPGMDAVVHLDEAGVAGYPLHHNLDRLFTVPHPPPQEAITFLIAALGVWAGDKLLPRRAAADAWSREIALHLPASPPWERMAPAVAELLHFLTGDHWVVQMREDRSPWGLKGVWPHPWRPEGVMLFSGGVDSLVGALDGLEAGRRLILVSHYDFGQLAGIQQMLAAALTRHYGPDRVHHLGLRVQFPQAPELTLRSRSLLYLALGLVTAAAFAGDLPLIIPENGWISLNPPLTLNRLGTYSTRTTHPHFLDHLTSLWRAAGLGQTLINPYQHLTKGEMVAQCHNRPLLQRLYSQSISCARPVVSRWRGQAGGACGYCYPCLLRRAALHGLGWDNGADYLLEVLAAPAHLSHRTRGRDLRALLVALKTWADSPREIAARLYLGDAPARLGERHGQAHAVLARGFQEIARFFQDKSPEWVKAYLS